MKKFLAVVLEMTMNAIAKITFVKSDPAKTLWTFLGRAGPSPPTVRDWLLTPEAERAFFSLTSSIDARHR